MCVCALCVCVGGGITSARGPRSLSYYVGDGKVIDLYMKQEIGNPDYSIYELAYKYFFVSCSVCVSGAYMYVMCKYYRSSRWTFEQKWVAVRAAAPQGEEGA